MSTPSPGQPSLSRRGLFRAAGLVAGVAAGVGLPALAEARAVTGFHLFNQYSGRVLEIRGSSTANDGPAVIWLNNGSLTQQWSLTAANGFITLTNLNSRKVLEVPRSSTVAGTQLVQYDANGTATQQWRLQNVGESDYLMLVNRNSGKVAGITTSGDGVAVVQQTATGLDRQLWKIVPA
jgi:hypothetical protein